MSASVLCRAQGSRARVIGPLGYGTRGADRLSIAVPNGTVFAGPGPDRIRATGRNSVAWGGFGSDRIAVAGTNSVGAGGPGRDRIVAVGAALASSAVLRARGILPIGRGHHRQRLGAEVEVH